MCWRPSAPRRWRSSSARVGEHGIDETVTPDRWRCPGAGRNLGLQAEGQADQGEAGVKQGAEKLKDKANDAADKLTGDK